MRKWKKMFVSLLTICMLFTLMAGNALAADEPYFYTVRLYAGNVGTVNGSSDCVTIDSLSYGQIVDFSSVDIQKTDSKYYIKGIRRSGRDNNEVSYSSTASFPVDGDADYVVAYGIEANKVAYTVSYQDANGNQLAPSNTYYGDIGDKPVVAYLYIENYIPQALAMTGTLVANEANNQFTFVYTPGESGGLITETTVVTVTEGTTAGTAGAAGTTTAAAGTATGTAAGTAAGNAAADEAATDAARTDDNTVVSPDEETPQSLIDKDDETPASDIKVDEEDLQKGFPLAAGIIIGVAALIALAVLLIYLKKHHTAK